MKTICSYIDFTVHREDDGTYWLIDNEDVDENGKPAVHEVEWVFATLAEDATLEELFLTVSEENIDYDYSGELDNVPVYAFWKIINETQSE